jgi:hypothetical protein
MRLVGVSRPVDCTGIAGSISGGLGFGIHPARKIIIQIEKQVSREDILTG